MLHEVFFAFSGYESPLLSDGAEELPHVSPAERALLNDLNRTASLHKALKSHVSEIASSHPSTICRVVANTIASVYLSRFQATVLEVERQILTKDSATVGAYNIVPLSTIVNRFRGWHRTLEWLWALACFVLPPENKGSPEKSATGVALINRLRDSTKTGYPDIEEIAHTLTGVAEKAWIRQLSNWLLLARPPPRARHDFFIREDEATKDAPAKFVADGALIPAFVTTDTASSILFVGKTLESIRQEPKTYGLQDPAKQSTPMMKPTFGLRELRPLSDLQSPLSAAAFSAEISQLRTILSERLVNRVLPVSKIVRTLQNLALFMLGGRDDFVDALIRESDKHLHARHTQTAVGSQHGNASDLASVIMKSGELDSILAKTWAAMAPSVSKGQALDDGLEWGRDHLSLEIAGPISEDKAVETSDLSCATSESLNLPEDRFFDFLISTPAMIRPKLEQRFYLAIMPRDVQAYGIINAYLVAIRRAHLRLGDLWRKGSFRKTPTPMRNTKRSRQRVTSAADRATMVSAKRATFMRSVWSCCSHAVVILAELGDYFTSEVSTDAWTTFYQWTCSFTNGAGEGSRPSTAESAPETERNANRTLNTSQSSVASRMNIHSGYETNKAQLLDPELLAKAHCEYLLALAEDILLTNQAFTKLLRTLLIHVDQLVALVTRLQKVQQNLDLQDEGVIENFSANYEQEEDDIKQQLERARDAVNDDLTSLVGEVKKLDCSGTASRMRTSGNIPKGETFEPWRSGGVDHLLIRLDSSVAGNDRRDDD